MPYRHSRIIIVAIFLVWLLSPSSISAAPLTIDFEGFNEGDAITTQFPDVVFSHATVVHAGSLLNEFELPPRSGVAAVVDDGGEIVLGFSAPIASFSGYFTYAERLTLTAFDAALNPIATIQSLFLNNLALSGDVGSTPNELLALSTVSGISFLTISGNPAGGSFVLDDVVVTPLATPVPEPTSLCLLGAGVATFALRRRRGR